MVVDRLDNICYGHVMPISPEQIRGPKVSVYYIHAIPVKVAEEQGQIKPKRHLRKRFFVPLIIMVTLGIGAFAGGLTVWESKLGFADKDNIEGQISPEAAWTNTPSPIPIPFDQSELNIVADLLPVLIEENRHEPTPEELEQYRYEQRRDALREYFQKRKSPFAKDDSTLDAFLTSKNMKLMIAISFVESTMGQRCYYNNCSGIGGTPPSLRKYDDFAGWVTDFDSLLERRYKGLPIEEFIGLYVQPGSPQWLNGVKQILAELKEAGID
jgi:hypothetical protein